MLVDPGLRGFERLRLDAAGADAADLLRADEATLFQHPDMFQQRRQGQLERRGQFGDGLRPVAQTADDRPAGRIAKRLEGPVQIE